jgi:hypothetical protein
MPNEQATTNRETVCDWPDPRVGFVFRPANGGFALRLQGVGRWAHAPLLVEHSQIINGGLTILCSCNGTVSALEP